MSTKLGGLGCLSSLADKVDGGQSHSEYTSDNAQNHPPGDCSRLFLYFELACQDIQLYAIAAWILSSHSEAHYLAGSRAKGHLLHILHFALYLA